MKRHENNKRNDGFTLIELLIVIAIIAILAALALPNMMSSRKAAQETNAIAVMREVVSAQEIFLMRRLAGSERYGTVAELGNTPVGNYKLLSWPDPATPGLRRGYQFVDLETPTATTWCIAARPEVPGKSGDRYFASTENGHIRQGSTDPQSRADVTTMSMAL